MSMAAQGPDTVLPGAPEGPGAFLRANKHLVIVTILLVACAIFWLAFRNAIHLTKFAVPWPDAVKVDDQWRNTSFPVSVGPYRLADKGKGDPWDGEIVQTELGTLGMGTNLSTDLFKTKTSNWYFSRIYRDMRQGPNEAFAYWRLDVTYYTGVLDAVPHVPEVCGAAAGAAPQPAGELQVSLPGAPPPWNEPLKLRRVVLNMEDPATSRTYQSVVYYVFSLNGRPQDSRESVRLLLMNPLSRYSYFAKIQISPAFSVSQPDEADVKAREFATHIMPIILKDHLPTADDVSRLESAGR